MQARLDGALRNLELARGLLLTQSFEIPQHQDRALIGFQRFEHAPDVARQRGIVWLRKRRLTRMAPLSVRIELGVAPRTTRMPDRLPDRDAPHPSHQRSRLAQRMQITEDLDQRLLSGVLPVVEGDRSAERPDERRKSIHELREREPIPRLCLANQLEISHVFKGTPSSKRFPTPCEFRRGPEPFLRPAPPLPHRIRMGSERKGGQIMQEITIVGGGLAGLVAAISVAEKGASVILEEARPRLGGRGHSARCTHKVNHGPHALYRHGALEAWLLERKLLPKTVFPGLTAVKLLDQGKLKRMPLPLLPMSRSAKREAPTDRSYREWATEILGERSTEAAVGFASLPTFHHDPGILSAAFIQERIQRSLAWRPVYYVCGGWQQLVATLEERARSLDVRIVTGSARDALPDGPVIVATELETASKLLDDDTVAWPRTSTAIYDIAFEARRGDTTAVLSLDDRIYASNYASGDPSVTAEGGALVQASAGLRPGESHEHAWQRIEKVFDVAWPDWRERTNWQRKAVAVDAAGPADPPGTSWRDRPAIDRGNGRYLVGDCVAAPGVLSEVSFESAIRAADLVAEKHLGVRA